MVTELIIAWIVGVVAFFVLWAILLKVVHRISEKRNNDEKTESDNNLEINKLNNTEP